MIRNSRALLLIGERAVLSAKHFIAQLEVCNVFTNRFNCSGVVDTQAGVFWFAKSGQRAQKPQAADS